MEKGFILSLIIAAIVGIFALANGDVVEIDLIFTKIFMSQAIIIFISTLLGAVIVSLLSWVRTFKLKKEVRDLNRKTLLLEEEKHGLEVELARREEQVKSLNDRNKEIIDDIAEMD